MGIINECSLNPNKNSSFQSPSSNKNTFHEKKNQPNLETNSNSQTEPNHLIPVFNLSFSPNGSKHDSKLPYNPLTNYTAQRPEFLRYNPNRKNENFLSIEQGINNENEEGFEKISTLKRTFKIVFLFACLVLSIHSICSIGLNQEFELNTKGSEMNGFGENFLGEMIGLSYICLDRNWVDFTCGIEERKYYEENNPIIEILPSDLNGFEPKENVSFTANKLELEERETAESLLDIGSLAQQDKEEDLTLTNSSNSHLEELIEMDLIDSYKPIDLKTQVYLLYFLQTLACVSILIAFFTSFCKYITKKSRKSPKPGIEIPENEIPVNQKPGIEIPHNEKNREDLGKERPVLIEKRKEFRGVKPPQVELLAEFSFKVDKENKSLVKGNKSLVKGFGANGISSSCESSVLNEKNRILFEETKENAPFVFNNSMDKMQKKEEIKEQKEAIIQNEIITPLRRSSRIRTKITSP